MVQPVRQLQRPRHLRHAGDARFAGHLGDSGGQLGQRGRLRRRVRSRSRNGCEDPRTRKHGTGQDRAEPSPRSTDPAHTGRQAGDFGRGGPPGFRAVLREPQLASFLPAGNQAARVRDLGRPRLSCAGCRDRAGRVRQPDPRMRTRLRRARRGGRDPPPPSHPGGSARELQPARRRVRSGRCVCAGRRLATHPGRGHLDRASGA